MALITKAYLRAMPLGIRDSEWAKVDRLVDPESAESASNPNLLDDLIDIASEQVASYCERQLESGPVTQSFWGNGRRRKMLKEWPVTALASASSYDGNTLVETYTDDDFRILDGGIIEFIDELNEFDPDLWWTVTYTAGYTTVPGPIRHATALWVTELMQPNFAGAQKEAAAIIPLSSEQIVELLQKYRRESLR